MKEPLFQRLTRIPYQVRWQARHLRLGQQSSRWRGAGLAFDQIKEAYDGAAMRSINWAATARCGGTPLLVNTYDEDKDITVMLLVDLSASMHFGSIRLSKKALAAEISASLVYSARLAHDRVGLLGFTSQVELYAPPRQSRSYQWAIPQAILHSQPVHLAAHFETAVAALELRVKPRALVFLLSDFFVDDVACLSRALERLRAQHDLVALVITDPREATLPEGHGSMALRDLETGKVTVYRLSARNRRRMEAVAQARQANLQELFEQLGIAYIVATPHSDYAADLTQLFAHRRHRRLRS